MPNSDPLAELAAYWRPVVDATTAEPQSQFSFAAHPSRESAGGSGAAPPQRRSTTFTPQEQYELAKLITDMAAERPQVDTNALDAAYAKQTADVGPKYSLNPFGM